MFKSLDVQGVTERWIDSDATRVASNDIVNGVLFGTSGIDEVREEWVCSSRVLEWAAPSGPLRALPEVRDHLAPDALDPAEELFPVFFELVEIGSGSHCLKRLLGSLEFLVRLVGVLHT
ncbi:MAG: hypothetical protein ACOZJX_04180 [Pseudomonadota bacterium]